MKRKRIKRKEFSKNRNPNEILHSLFIVKVGTQWIYRTQKERWICTNKNEARIENKLCAVRLFVESTQILILCSYLVNSFDWYPIRYRINDTSQMLSGKINCAWWWCHMTHMHWWNRKRNSNIHDPPNATIGSLIHIMLKVSSIRGDYYGTATCQKIVATIQTINLSNRVALYFFIASPSCLLAIPLLFSLFFFMSRFFSMGNKKNASKIEWAWQRGAGR